MPYIKKNIFSPAQLRKARLAKALGHPARIAILEFLMSHQRCSSRKLTQEISLSQSTLAQHLKLLKNAGLLGVEIIGKETRYYINELVWVEHAIGGPSQGAW